MRDPVRHVVVDANVLSAFCIPCTVASEIVRERARILLNAAFRAQWPSLKLYVPAICVAEVLATFDRYRHCDWYGPLKRDSAKRISQDEYTRAQELLTDVERSQSLHRMEQEPKHVLAAGLLSPIDARFQVCRPETAENRARQPAGAADCLIAGMAIMLSQQLGRDSVVLTTADVRLSDVIYKARSLKQVEAEELSLESAARRLDLEWDPELYPECVNLQAPNIEQLRRAFLGWPLPERPLKVRDLTELSPGEKELLVDKWNEVKAERRFGGPDSLPYSEAIDDLRARFSVESGLYLRNEQIYRFLQNLRKAGKLSESGSDPDTSVEEDPTLFDCSGP